MMKQAWWIYLFFSFLVVYISECSYYVCAIRITAHPANVTAKAGESVLIRCEYEGAGTSLPYWRINGMIHGALRLPSSVYMNVYNKGLNITHVYSWMNNTSFSCAFSATIESETAYLTVTNEEISDRTSIYHKTSGDVSEALIMDKTETGVIPKMSSSFKFIKMTSLSHFILPTSINHSLCTEDLVITFTTEKPPLKQIFREVAAGIGCLMMVLVAVLIVTIALYLQCRRKHVIQSRPTDGITEMPGQLTLHVEDNAAYESWKKHYVPMAQNEAYGTV